MADRLLATLERTGARRLVVDSMAELERAVRRNGDPGRVDEYLAALTVATHRRGVTAVLLKETPMAVAGALDYAADPLGMVVDNVLLLQQLADGSRLRRVLSVVKTRFSAHDTALHSRLTTTLAEPGAGSRRRSSSGSWGICSPSEAVGRRRRPAGAGDRGPARRRDRGLRRRCDVRRRGAGAGGHGRRHDRARRPGRRGRGPARALRDGGAARAASAKGVSQMWLLLRRQ